MPVLRTGIEQTYLQPLRRREEHWHNFQETTDYMRELSITHLSGTGPKVSRSLLTISVYLPISFGLKDMYYQVTEMNESHLIV